MTFKPFKAAAVRRLQFSSMSPRPSKRPLAFAREAAGAGAELIVFPEVFVAGYPYELAPLAIAG